MADKASTIAAIQAAIAATQAIGTPPPPTGALSVTLDFGGGSVAQFDSASAVDAGEFVGEFVRQRCALDVDPAFPDWRVWFRPDSDGTRDEVVIEYGRTKAGSLATMGYTATISRAGATLYTVTVPKHYGYSRWRWQSSQRPVVRTPAVLKARGWLPNFGTAGLFGQAANTASVPWNGPMSAPGGFDPVMGNAGNNAQIGYLTTFAADYVIHGSPASLISIRTEGEWVGNWCIHLRDDVTGAPLDVRGQALRTADNGGTINSYPALNAAGNAGFVEVDGAHRYPCANLPWLLTDDPYLLEELQFGCNRHVLDGQYHRSANNLQGMVYPGQTRSFAWGIRDLFLAALTTPANVPSWLRPKSYWQACVDDNKTYALKFVNAPARLHALFKTWTRTDMDGAWQSAWLNAVVGMAVGMGFADWLPIFQWGIDKHIQQTNGTSGWSRQWPVPYYSHPDTAAPVPSLVLGAAYDLSTRTSWADYWNDFKAGSPKAGVLRTAVVNDAGWDGTTLMQTNSGPSYYLHLRSVLAVAVTRGIPGAQACYDYIQSELTNEAMARFAATGQPAFSIDPEAGVPTPPPVGAPTIANPTATPQSLPASGGNVVINATVTNATAVTLDGAPVTLPTTKAVTVSRSFVLSATGATPPPATASIAVTVAATPPPPPPPSGEVVAVDSAQRFQTMRGWEATAIGWAVSKTLNAYDPTWVPNSAATMSKLANDIGINRLQLPVRSGWMNTTDYWSQFVAGSINYVTLGSNWYHSMTGAPTQFSEFDFTVSNILQPMRTAMQARGETLVVSLVFTDFNGAAGRGIELASNPVAYAAYVKQFVVRLQAIGVTVDSIDVILEPENAGNWFNGTRIGNAIVALRAAVGPSIKLIAPSCTRAVNTITVADAIAAVPGALAALNVLGYHRYGSGDAAQVPAILAWAKARGKETGMTEWYPATIDTLLDDLLLGGVSLWQRWGIAFAPGGSMAGYFGVTWAATPPTYVQNAPQLSLVFPYVRMNAVRIGCTSSMRAVAFENANGKQTVFAKRTAAAATVTITGLRPGVYGVRAMASGASTATNGADVTADASGRATVAFVTGCTTIYEK